MNIQTLLANLKANQKQALVISAVCAGLVGICLISTGDEQKVVRVSKKTDRSIHVLTDKRNHNLGNDALAAKIESLSKEIRRLKSDNERLNKDLSDTRGNDALERQMRERFEKLTLEIARLRDLQAETMTRVPQPMGFSTSEGEKEIVNPFEVATPTIASQDALRAEAGLPLSAASGSVKTANALTQKTSRKRVTPGINVVSEEEIPTYTKGKSRQKNQTNATVNYIPAGSILTGTLVTGGDFPTGMGAKDNPMPVLIRLTKTAILPNRYQSDVRECFMLMSGHGDLSSERAKFRGETLSCLRHDGGVINTKLSSYVAGEDGKEGIKGRLVSKQGQLIARTLVAGFLAGISKAFDYTPVGVLSTTPSGTVQYQNNFSKDAVKGGLATGASNAAEKVANFYAKLAESMVPVVEITPGRQVDIVVVSGTKIDPTVAARVQSDKTATIED